MRKALVLILAALLVPAGLLPGAAKKRSSSSARKSQVSKKRPAARKTTAKKGTATAKKGTTTAKKGAAAAKKGATTAKKSSKKGRGHSKTSTAQTWRSRQLTPTSERYLAIQQALAEKGYLKSPPSGAWNADSADALRRFQKDQNLQANGKIDSLSLIALGLGPKYDTTSASSAPAAKPSQP